MKTLKFTLGFLLLIIVSSCVTTMPINQNFYNQKKVGVVIQIDKITMSKVGSQGLLDMALTSGNRFKEPLEKIESKLNLSESLHAEVASILKNKNKEFIFIDENIEIDKLPKFVKNTNSNQKFAKVDYRKLKSAYNVDEILIIKSRYGLLVSYYGFIELDKQGYVALSTEIVDLNDNSLLQQDQVQKASSIKGKWKEGEEYENLKNAIQDAINQSVEILGSKF